MKEKGKRKSRFRIIRTISPEPMSKEDYEKAEKILARLVAEAYVADHPEISEPVKNLPREGKTDPDSNKAG